MSATNVGVLELTIESNASSAATSLGGLADALTRVKEAVGTNSFGLGEVGKQLNTFAKQVAQAKSTVSVLKTISEFGNALSKLSKIGQFSVDTESFEKLKTAVSGFSIGNIGSQMNQLRLAMSGTWGDGKSAQSMSDLHDKIQAFANDTPVLLDFAMAMKDASSSLTEMNQSVTASGDWRMSMMGVSSSESVSTGANVAAGLETGMESSRESLVAVATELADAMIEVFRSRLEINSPSKVTTRFGEYTGEGLAVGLQNSMPEVVRATGDITDSIIEKMGEITEREKYIGLDLNQFLPDTVSSLPGIFRDMSDTVALLSDSVGVTLPKMQQMSSDEMVVAGNAKEATVAIDGLMKRLNSGKGWSGGKLDGFKNLAEFINFSQGIGMQFTSQSGEADELLKNANRLNGAYTETEHVVSQVKTSIDEAVDSMRQGNIESSQWYQNAVKLNKEMAEKYAPHRNQTFEEWYNGFRPGTGYVKNDLMSKWLHGEGTKNEQQYALEQTARKFGMSVDEVKAKIAELKAQYTEFNNMANEGQGVQTATQKFFDNLGIPQTNAADMVKSLVGDVSQVDLMEAKLQGLQQSLTEDIQNNKLSAQQMADRAIQIQNLTEKIQELKDKQDAANSSTKESSFTWKDFKGVIKAMFPTLTSLLKRFKSMTIMRAMRYMIRQISAGFREGVQNVYQYSRAIGSSFAPAMDSAATSLLQMKNSIGAAAAPVIQALIPVLQTVVNWLITGINYLNQFFALLNGQKTWTRALPATTTAFNNQEKAAKGAGAAIKDLLADWDELNIIQSESGGGGGGSAASAAEDYLNMFEEVSVFEGKIKDIVNFIKDNFETIKTVAGAIGAALLAWKIANGVESVLDKISMLKGGIIMSVIGFSLSAAAGASFADNGLTVGNVLMAIGGLAAAGFGGYWVGSAALASLGLGAAGGAVGAIAGVAIALAFMINSYQVRSAENAYGSLEEDADTIRKNVMSYFNPKVTSEIDVVNARIKDEEDAKKKVEDALTVLEKDYPIAISLKTEETLKTLSTDVSNLVEQANALILLRKQNIRIPIVSSGQYENADSLLKFSDEQWDATSEYVTKLGERIGELISKGITDGAELDGLQQRLSNIVRAITYGQTSGEFAGKMSLASANLRNNGYTKSTVEGYIATYKQERQNIVDKANAAAVAEKSDLKALYASVEERYKNHEATYAELRTAAEAYKKFDVNKEAERYIKEWLAEGDSMFVSDLASGLKGVMASNKNVFLKNAMDTMINQASSREYGYGNDAEEYIENLRDDIYNELSRGTGFSKDELSGILGLAGVDPMSLLPDDFGDRLRKAIAKRLEGGGFTETEKEKIISEFGLTDDDFSAKLSTINSYIAGLEGAKEYLQNIKTYHGSIFGGTETRTDIEKAKETVERTKITAPSVDTKPFDKSMTYIENAALNAVNYVKRMIESLSDFSVNVSVTERNKAPEGGVKRYMQTRASGGFVRSGDLVMANENGNFELMGKMGNQPVVANNQQIISGISQGVATANGDVVSELRTLASLMQKMLNKEFVAKAIPGSDWGQHNSRSNDAWSKVNG